MNAQNFDLKSMGLDSLSQLESELTTGGDIFTDWAIGHLIDFVVEHGSKLVWDSHSARATRELHRPPGVWRTGCYL